MWTVEQWRVIPDDLFRHQIIDGVHYKQHAPTTRHQEIVGNLLFSFDRSADRCGEIFTYVGVELSAHDAVVPDLVFVAKDQRHILTNLYIEGAPAIIIEIVEDDTRDMDERIKRSLYERVGVLEYWLVDRDRDTVKILRRGAGTGFEEVDVLDSITSPLVPGYVLGLNAVFSDWRAEWRRDAATTAGEDAGAPERA